jgi:glutamate carboxypeptidase
MQQLSASEQALLAPIAGAPTLDQVLAWSAINTGTRNLAGLAMQAQVLADAFAVLPGTVELHAPAPVETVAADGTVGQLDHGAHLVVRVRPEAPRRYLLTGHMDTVFPAHDPFQATTWLDETTLGGPGVADMKGGIAVMLAALQAFEASPAAARSAMTC